MVSDYKFHLFCKRLKKEKWRFSKDLSPAMMLLIFHCCLWMTWLGEPNVGCTELSGRIISCHEKFQYPCGHHYRVPVLQILLLTSLLTLFMGCEMQLTFKREIISISGKGRLKAVSVCGKYLFPSSNAKRNIKEIAFLERLKGSNKLSSAGCQHFPPPVARSVRLLLRRCHDKEVAGDISLEQISAENKQRDILCHPILRRISAQASLKLLNP